MEFFLIFLILINPFILYFSNYLKNKKNENFFYMLVPCAVLQLIMGIFNTLTYQDFYVYSFLSYLILFVTLIGLLVYSFLPLFDIDKNRKILKFFYPLIFVRREYGYYKNLFTNMVKDLWIPTLWIVLACITMMFLQNHWHDTSLYKIFSANYQYGIYSGGGFAEAWTASSPISYQTASMYYVIAAFSTYSIAFMYNYVLMIFSYSFFIYFVWDLISVFCYDQNDKKSLIKKSLILMAAISLLFISNSWLSGGNYLFATSLIVVTIYYIKNREFLKIYIAIVFGQFFSPTGSLVAIPFVLAILVYVFIFYNWNTLIKYILLYASALISPVALVLTPTTIDSTRTILYLVYVAIAFTFLIVFLVVSKFKKLLPFDKQIIKRNLSINTRKKFIIYSVFYALITIISFAIVFYISVFDTYKYAFPVWCGTVLASAIFLYLRFLISYKKQEELRETLKYQITLFYVATLFTCLFYIVGVNWTNIMSWFNINSSSSPWNASTWRILFSISGATNPDQILLIYLINANLLYKSLNKEFWNKLVTKLKIKKYDSKKVKKIVATSFLTTISFGSPFSLAMYESFSPYDVVIPESNVEYLKDFTDQQIQTLKSINEVLGNYGTSQQASTNNLVAADIPVFQYIHYAQDVMGYNYSVWNLDIWYRTVNRAYSPGTEVLWNEFISRLSDPSRANGTSFLDSTNYNIKMIILSTRTFYYSTFKERIDTQYTSFTFVDSNQIKGYNFISNTDFGIWIM